MVLITLILEKLFNVLNIPITSSYLPTNKETGEGGRGLPKSNCGGFPMSNVQCGRQPK